MMLDRLDAFTRDLARGYARLPRKARALVMPCAYVLLFCAMSLVLRAPLLLTGRSIVWQYDSSGEYYLATEAFVGAVRGLFSGTLPAQYDFSIGLGGDVIASLGFYGYGDPLLALLALLPLETEALFTLGVFLRQLLCGLFFYGYLRKMRVRRGYALIGALSYAFCAFVGRNTLKHQNFLNAAMYLPLVLSGYEQFAQKRKPLGLILSVCLLALSSYYFLYMISLFLLVYALFRFFECHAKGARAKALPKLILGALGCYLTGILLAGALLLPGVYGFFHSARVPEPLAQNLLTYPPDELLARLSRFLFPMEAQFETIALWAVFGAVLLATDKRLRKGAIWALLLVAVYLLFPLPSYILNGFSYISNRSVFLVSFLASVVLVRMIDPLTRLDRREKWLMTAVVAVGYALFVLSVVTGKDMEQKQGYYLYMLAFGVAASAIVYLLWLANTPRARRVKWLPLAAALVAVTANLGFNELLYGLWRCQGGQLLPSGKVDAVVAASPGSVVGSLNDDSFYRVEIPEQALSVRNEALALDFHPTSCYLSVQNADNLGGLTALEDCDRVALQFVTGLDDRAALLSALNVKYFADDRASTLAAPYGFEKAYEDERFIAYRNRNALPLGYSTDAYLTTADYAALDALGKQQALLQAAVLERVPEGLALKKAQIAPAQEALAYEIIESTGVTWAGGVLDVATPGAQMTLRFDARANGESYLRFEGLDVDRAPYEITSVQVRSDGVDKRFYACSNRTYQYNYGQYHYLVNLGVRDAGPRTVTITFAKRGKVALQDLQVLHLPVDGMDAQVAALCAQPLTDITHARDRIDATVNFQGDRVLVLGIPYSAGWHATVDGQPARLDRSIGLTTALPLPAGTHRITLVYDNPWRTAGLVATLAGLALLLVACTPRRGRREATRRKRRGNREAGRLIKGRRRGGGGGNREAGR
ncbi:MAG: YfhO family protein [Clostridia bacterium]